MAYAVDEYDRVVGARVRALRLQCGWSQTDLASRLAEHGLEYHQTTIGKLETGARPIRIGEVHALARIFDTSLHELLDGTAPLPASTSRELADAYQRLVNVIDATRPMIEKALRS